MCFVLLFLLHIIHVSSQEIEKYRVSNNRILDQYDREAYFHGLNVVYKSAPYLPITDHFDANLSFSTQDMEILNSWGLNLIRLGVMWPGVEPQRNYYNMTYINEAANIINTSYSKYNISTLVDCHQDVLSQALCGEGAPVWATDPVIWNMPEPLGKAWNISSNDHIPSKEQCAQYSWASYYSTEAASSAFQRLYENHNGLADQFADYFGKIAFEFRNISGIVGFELMNEPWAGNIYRDPFLMYPGTADRLNLQPFYDRIQPKIYGNDSDRMIFFESVTWTDEFNISLDDIGFEHVPGGIQYANKSVFAFHYYSSPNAGSEDKYFSQRTDDGKRLNATSFCTETGANYHDNPHGMYYTLDMCDKYLVSWALWEYKPLAGSIGGTCTGCSYGAYYPNGSINVQNVKGYSRTYAQFVAGHARLISFDWKSNPTNFTLIYEVNTNIKQPTKIYTSMLYWYPNGYDIKIIPESVIKSSVQYGNYIEIYNSDDQKYNGQTVTVTIIAK